MKKESWKKLIIFWTFIIACGITCSINKVSAKKRTESSQTVDDREYSAQTEKNYCADAYEFCEGLALIEVQKDEQVYWGFIDSHGKITCYLRAGEYDDPEITFVDHGYISIVYNNELYIVDRNGKCSGRYRMDNVLAYGAGYVWVKEEGESSWDDAGKSSYTLYDPDGEKVEKASFSVSNEQDYEGTFKYLEDGVFLYTTSDDCINDTCSLYFSQPGFLRQYPKNIFYNAFYDEDEYYNFGKGYYIYSEDDYYDENSAVKLKYISSEAEEKEIIVPNEYHVWGDIYDYFIGNTEKYIFLRGEDQLVAYDMEKEEFTNYQGEYFEKIDSDNIKVAGDYMAVGLYGKDSKYYVGLINVSDMNEIDQPIEAADFQLFQDMLIVKGEENSEIYDMNLKKLITINGENEIRSAGNGALIIREDEGYRYIDRMGKELFPKGIDFSSAVNIL